jgi:hypothetical protein
MFVFTIGRYFRDSYLEFPQYNRGFWNFQELSALHFMALGEHYGILLQGVAGL